MLGKLLQKELRLAMHPTVPLFLLLSAMLLISNYPYYVVFFYTTLALFFTCLLGRENHDVFYSLTLPIAKRDVVKSRLTFAVLTELAQMALAIPFALLRQNLSVPGNEAGMDANIALFGLAFVLYGVFNRLFFTAYYRHVDKVGVAFVKASIAVFVYIGIAEACAFAVPFFRERLDTPDPQFLGSKLLVLAVGFALYALLTWRAYVTSVCAFEKADL